MKKLLVQTLIVLISATRLGAVPDWNGYADFKLTKELWVCSSIAFPVDIAYDAFNVDFKTVVLLGAGYFIQVRPGEHMDGLTLPSGSTVIEDHAKGVFNPVGKPAGIYEYIFVCATNSFCGMSYGDQAVVRIYLVPQPTAFPVLTNVCPGNVDSVDFDKFMPAEVRYFLDETGWKVSYKKQTGAGFADAAMPVEASVKTVGNNIYLYSFDDRIDTVADPEHAGFYGKYSAMQRGAYFCPDDSSSVITHTVRIRDGRDFIIPDRTVSFCLSTLLSVPETNPRFRTNLFGYLGTAVDGGVWRLGYASFPPTLPVYFDKVQNETEGYTGYVDIPVGMIASSNQTLPVTIRFDYHYKDCDGNSAVTRLTFMLTDDLTSVIVTDSAGREKEVCRNLVAGVIDLAATFGFHTPLTSGLWFEKLNDSSYVEMLYGAADISDKNSGSLYTYRYDVSSAIDSGLCLVEARTAYFHLRIRDVAVANGEVKICASEYENPGISLDLFRYVPGLNDTSRIRPGEVVWMLAGDTVASPYLLSKGGNPPADTANIQYQFQYNVKTECGEFTGDLYVSVIDSFPAKLELRRKICYTDDYAKHIDLFEVLGYGGLTGNFELLATNPPGKTLDLTMFDPTTSVMNANAAFDESNNEEVYTFRYVKGVNDSACLPANADLRVIITVTKEHDKD